MVYNEKLINFFKKHNLYNKEMFDYFQDNSIMIDYNDIEQRDFIGTLYTFDKKHRLKKIYLIIPYIQNEITFLINVHEIIHGIELYKKLDKITFITKGKEILPMLYESIYIKETNNKELKKYQEELDLKIKDSDEEYLLGLNFRNELLNKYNYDYNKIKLESNKMLNKYLIKKLQKKLLNFSNN